MTNEELLKVIEKAKVSGATELNLRGEGLQELSPAIGQLTNLTDLNLSGNQLTELPPEIFHLTKLARLNLSQNYLAELPHEICKLTSLTALYLGGNQLTKLPPEICQLTGLARLSLSGNKLTALPPDIIRLIKLVKISLRGNQLTKLPPEIIQLPNLNDLDIRRNELTELPSQLFYLPKLETLELHDNPLSSPPLEIANQGLDAIRTYFAAGKGETQLVNEVKIILVGEGAAGKTSLVKKLLGQEFDPKEETTYGISIRGWDVEVSDRQIRGNIWDFGGQVIMHATHQFFMSKRSLYVLVLDNRRNQKAEYWLRHIESFGGNSPVLIVLNKCDADATYDLNRPELLRKFPGIKGFFRTSCSTDAGVAEFKAALIKELAQVEMIGIRWPTSWFEVKERLEQMPKSYISCDEYKTFCEEAGISEADSRERLVDFLHDLGVAVHFKEFDLNGTYVLDPKWVTAAVYKIITAKRVANDKGILHVNSLTEILKKQDKDVHDFPVLMHRFILDLMKQFQLCYSLDSETVLIPQLLDVVEPEFEFDYASSLQFAFLYDDFLPLSILSRFMVKVHKDIRDKQCWLTGVVLKDERSGSIAVVKADAEKRRISIWVNGPRRKEYLHFLWYSLREINSSFEKLPVRERIPMPDDPERTADYETLLKHVKRGNDIYYAEGSDKEYSVKALLGLVQPKNNDELLAFVKKMQLEPAEKESFIDWLLQVVKIKIPFVIGEIDLTKLFELIRAWDKQRQRQSRN